MPCIPLILLYDALAYLYLRLARMGLYSAYSLAPTLVSLDFCVYTGLSLSTAALRE